MKIHAKTFEHNPLCSTQRPLLKGFRLRSYSFFKRSENVGGLQGARNPASGGLERPGGRECLPPNVLACPTGFKYRLVEILRLTAHG